MRNLIKKAQTDTNIKYHEFVTYSNKEFDNFRKTILTSGIEITQKAKMTKILEETYPAYLAPSLMLFSYKTRFRLKLHDNKKDENPIDSYIDDEKTNSAIEVVYMEHVLHSIRNLIERIGGILNLIHPEISQKDGFGYINDSKPEGIGVLKYALLHKQNEFMKYLIDSYYSWISIIKKSDNFVKHETNLKTMGLLDWSKHSTMPIILTPVSYDVKQNIHYDNERVDQITRDCYKLINKTIQYTIEKLVQI